MTRRPSIGFIQLPVPDTQSANARANVPLAAAYLKATCLEAGLAAARQVRILPRELANHGGDRAAGVPERRRLGRAVPRFGEPHSVHRADGLPELTGAKVRTYSSA